MESRRGYNSLVESRMMEWSCGFDNNDCTHPIEKVCTLAHCAKFLIDMNHTIVTVHHQQGRSKSMQERSYASQQGQVVPRNAPWTREKKAAKSGSSFLSVAFILKWHGPVIYWTSKKPKPRSSNQTTVPKRKNCAGRHENQRKKFPW